MNGGNKDRDITRIASLIIANAMIFQEQLANSNPRVMPLAQLEAENLGRDLASKLVEHWEYINTNINYVPIFSIAKDLLVIVSSSPCLDAQLSNMAAVARQIVGKQAALRHDLAGRIFHRLLLDAKELGACYTSISAATLLLKLALRPDAWTLDWHDLGEIKQLRLADLACGTGTLLMAATQAINDNYIRACVETHSPSNSTMLHQVLAEDVIYGYDVQSSAVHLSATTIALLAPDVTFEHMHLYTVPFTVSTIGCEQSINLGSLDILRKEEPHWSRGDASIPLPRLDLCVINPPFNRSVGSNLLFGSLPIIERKKAHQELKKIIRDNGVTASLTAGLGSAFVAAADKLLRSGGRLALVLPRSLTSGVAWKKTRETLARSYVIEYIIVSHDPVRWSFSENTSLSEVLLVARKEVQPDCKSKTVCVNLWRNPSTQIEALAIADNLSRNAADTSDSFMKPITIGEKKWGEAISIPWSQLQDNTWFTTSFAQADLTSSVHSLALNGMLVLPGCGQCGFIPLEPLGTQGRLGPDRRDIFDAFVKSNVASSPYCAMWGHNAGHVKHLAHNSNSFLEARVEAIAGRKLRDPVTLWKRAGRVLIAERFRLNTGRVVAIRTPEKVLSNVWWSFDFHSLDTVSTTEYEKTLVLWLNSTLGILLFCAYRGETEGSWVHIKKPVLSSMPVLKLAALKDKIQHLALVYDSLSGSQLLPLSEMAYDRTRATIDNAISHCLDLPDLAPLRRMLSFEPVISGTSLFT